MKKNTIKIVGTLAAVLVFATGCGKVPKLENGQDAVITLKGERVMEDIMLYAGDAVKELEEAEKLSAKTEGIVSITTQCGDGNTFFCC